MQEFMIYTQHRKVLHFSSKILLHIIRWSVEKPFYEPILGYATQNQHLIVA